MVKLRTLTLCPVSSSLNDRFFYINVTGNEKWCLYVSMNQKSEWIALPIKFKAQAYPGPQPEKTLRLVGLRELDLVENIIVQIRQLISIYVIFVPAASNLQSCSGDKIQQTRSCHSVLRLREATHEREVFLPILRIMH